MVHRIQIQRETHHVHFMLDGPFQDAPDATTLLRYDKIKGCLTTEMIQMHYKYVHTLFNHLQAMATNGLLPNHL